jgi:poly(3-hydroxybutyrate) depolymerase
MSFNKNIKSFFLLILLLVNYHSYAQSLCSAWPRFDQEVFQSVTKRTDVTFGSNFDYQNINTVLQMDIYEPAGDTMAHRPLIIFAHGGSFVAGDKSNTDQVNLCTHFAKRGYVTATIDYRLGMFPINQATATDAVYRGVQDMKAAIRFFRKDAATVDSFKIDPAIIFIGGTSAGAFAAMHTAYFDTYAELPASIDTALLGDLDGNSGNPGYPVNVNAVINLCGALGEASWIIPNDPPLVSMHGTADATVPYGSAMLYLLGIFPIMVVDGSYAIHNYLQTTGHPAEMYTWSGAGHVPYDGGTPAQQAYLDTTLRFVSNFLYKQLGCTPSDPQPLANTSFTSAVSDNYEYPLVTVKQNPVSGELILENIIQPVTLKLVNISGQVIYNQDVAEKQVRIAVDKQPPGTYFLHFKAVNKMGVLKIVVQ